MKQRELLKKMFIVGMVSMSLSTAFAADDDDDNFDDGGGPPVEDSEDFDSGPGQAPDNAQSEKPSVTMGLPRVAGTGCKNGTYSATLSPDKKVLSVIFDEYMAESGDSYGRTRDRKTCDMLIPFKVPRGYRVSVVKMDYRGFGIIPNHAKAQFRAAYHMLDAKTGRIYKRKFARTKTLQGPYDDDFILTTRIRNQRRLWTACGRDFNVRVSTNLGTITNPNGDDVIAGIDSVDTTEKSARYHLIWKKCTRQVRPRPRPMPRPRPGPRPIPRPGPRPIPRPRPPVPVPVRPRPRPRPMGHHHVHVIPGQPQPNVISVSRIQ